MAPKLIHSVSLQKQLTAVKVCEAYAARIRQVQPIVNAVTQDRFKEALEEARAIDQLLAAFRANHKSESDFSPDEQEMLQSPLLGIPISIKESIMVKGMRNTCGLWHRREVRATEDAVVVRNIRRTGMIPLCTTNVPEGTLYWADCHNTVYGRSLNPYDLNRVTGASSGGEGALIASGGSLIGIGSDIGGSLRIPAHFCGINSHKPSPFLVSSQGNFPFIVEHRLRIFTLGPMTRYVSDLRPILKCLMSDKDNSKQDTYFKYQPTNIGRLRQEVMEKLEERSIDLSQVRIFYFNFNEQSQLSGKASVSVPKEYMESQEEILNHFKTKFNCHCEHINLDKYFKKANIIWQSLLVGGGAIDREKEYNSKELQEAFGIENIYLEVAKFLLGVSKHTKESLLSLSIGKIIPSDRAKAFEICDKFEKLSKELKSDFEAQLGDLGVLIMPTLPAPAYEHHYSLAKTNDLRFTSIFNSLQVPVTHVTIRPDRKFKLPYGFSVVGKPYNDALTISVGEEIEANGLGGWKEPNLVGLERTEAVGVGGGASTGNLNASADPANSKVKQSIMSKAEGAILQMPGGPQVGAVPASGLSLG